MSIVLSGIGAEKALNRLAREQMKHKLLLDIRADLLVCELNGWDKKEYLAELRDLLNSLGGEA